MGHHDEWCPETRSPRHVLPSCKPRVLFQQENHVHRHPNALDDYVERYYHEITRVGKLYDVDRGIRGGFCWWGQLDLPTEGGERLNDAEMALQSARVALS